ncbi:MAG: OmpH family outer membrane protein [Candidatus Omnitrophota bacterium]
MKTTMVKLFRVSLAALFLFGLIAPMANAADGVKIGYVDFRKAFYENDKAKTKEEELRAYEEEQQKKQKEMIDEITELRGEAEMLSAEAKEKKRPEIEKKIVALQDFENEVRKELLNRKNDIYKEIADDIQSVVDEVGEAGGYDYILDSRSVIYTSGNLDITDEVIKKIKAKK